MEREETRKHEPVRQRDKPWIFRTYAGHSTARDSNALYLKNIAKGQTGLSIAFDLPTQTGYDSDHLLARGEVGKVGVPISHLGDMRILLHSLPLGEMNTSMTINATAAWLLALYIAVAEEQGIPRAHLSGTTQNDIIKEYLSRGTYVFPPEPSLRLTRDIILFTTQEMPRWNPMNVCSYHLQEAGATPVQELAFSLATALCILDHIQHLNQDKRYDIGEIASRLSFFVNSGMKFITEMCKMRAFVELWDELLKERFGIAEEKFRRFRYGVQVNSLGLTEQQPENNAYRILIGMLGVVLSKKARARAVQLPAWNEALGLPRPFDQQWSLRLQQIMAYETDLLEFEDIFSDNPVIEEKVEELKKEAREKLKEIDAMGGALEAVASGYMKVQLVESNSKRLEAIEKGERSVVGVNCFQETEVSPLNSNKQGSIFIVPETVEKEQIENLKQWRETRDASQVQKALEDLQRACKEGLNIMEASIVAAKAGVTTGEWGHVLRNVFGEYRAPTGVGLATPNIYDEDLEPLRMKVDALSRKLGRRVKFLVGKPGLDGHSNGAEQIAVRARDCGMDIIYDGIRMTSEEIVQKALVEKVHCIGLSILSGSHLSLVHEILDLMRRYGLESVPLVVGGIIPLHDVENLKERGVAAVYTPKDFDLNGIIEDILNLIEKQG